MDSTGVWNVIGVGGRQHGLETFTHTEVTGFLLDENRVLGVKTTAGEHFASDFLLATGAWTRRLGHKLSLDLPI